MTKKVKPFLPQEKGYTIIDNVVFDYILPELTANGWKVLCFIIRKTKGWHKEWDGISYTQIMAGTGIKSSATISKVLSELMDGNYIKQVKADDQFTAAQYALNTALEIEVANGTTLEIEAMTNSENEVAPTSKNEDTKQIMKQRENKKEGAAEKTPPARTYLGDLFNGKMNGIREGEKLIQLAGWDIGSPDHRQAMAAFLEASRLPVPDKKTDRDDWMGSIDTHLHICAAKDLDEGYPHVVAHMRGDGLTVGRPGSVTNNLRSWWAEEKNGGKPNAKNSRHGSGSGLQGNRKRPEYKVADLSKFSKPGEAA